MKNNASRIILVAYCAFALGLPGCAGWFRRSTPSTTAYKEVHEHALGGQVPQLAESLRKSPGALNLGDANGDTPLMLASFHGHAEAVRFLLNKGARINNVNHEHQTALILAAKAGQRDVVLLLLQAKANATIQDARGWNAQTWAEKQGYPDVAEAIRSAPRKKRLIYLRRGK